MYAIYAKCLYILLLRNRIIIKFSNMHNKVHNNMHIRLHNDNWVQYNAYNYISIKVCTYIPTIICILRLTTTLNSNIEASKMSRFYVSSSQKGIITNFVTQAQSL